MIPVLAQIEKLVPGSGPLAERVEAFQNRFTIPTGQAEAGVRCRHRRVQGADRAAHRAAQGRERSTSASSPARAGRATIITRATIAAGSRSTPTCRSASARAVDLGCHEGYPGHHVLNVLLEQRLTKERGWIEYQRLSALFAAIAAGRRVGQLRHRAGLPGPRAAAYEARSPLPARRPADRRSAALSARCRRPREDLQSARFTIARELLEGRIDEAEAVRLSQRYQLVSPERARQLTDFTKQYRSYVINYGLGLDMVRADVEAAGPTPAARWKRMEQLLSEPTLPSDLRPRPELML